MPSSGSAGCFADDRPLRVSTVMRLFKRAYTVRDAFRLFAAGLDYFRAVVEWGCLGAGAGVTTDGDH